MSEAYVERQLVIDLPNRTDQCGECVRLAKFFLIEDFGHRADDPLRWTLNNKISEGIRPLITRERAGNVQMNRSPVPTLRDDTAWWRRSCYFHCCRAGERRIRWQCSDRTDPEVSPAE